MPFDLRGFPQPRRSGPKLVPKLLVWLLNSDAVSVYCVIVPNITLPRLEASIHDSTRTKSVRQQSIRSAPL